MIKLPAPFCGDGSILNGWYIAGANIGWVMVFFENHISRGDTKYIGPIEIEEPMPEILHVKNCKPSHITIFDTGTVYIEAEANGCIIMLHVRDNDKRRAIEAFNAAAKVLND